MSEEPPSQSLGQMIDSIGVEAELDAGDMVTDVVVLIKIMDKDGKFRMRTVANPGIGFLEMVGMLDLGHRGEIARFIAT